MASTSFVPLPHALGRTTESEEASDPFSDHQWPSLTVDHNKDQEWEIVPPVISDSVASVPVVTFDAAVISQSVTQAKNPKTLKHCQSSPDLRAWNTINDCSDQEEDSSSAVFIEEETSMASSAMDLVSEPPSVWSVGSARLSFKDAILQQSDKAPSHDPSTGTTQQQQRQPKKASFKTTFVVVKPVAQRVSAGMRRNSKSMGNLTALDHIQEDHDVMGDTDAGEFYCRKEKGAVARQNGQKLRPDEAKRLQITMAKKSMQKQRQRG